MNPLSIFYSVPRWEFHASGYIHVAWKCDPVAIPAIGRAGNLDFAGVSLANLDRVNTYFDRVLNTDRELVTVVVTNLYRVAAKPQHLVRNNCWFNFITAMTMKAAIHNWNKIPKSQQSEDLFERLVTPTLSIQQLVTSFNPDYHPNLLVGLQAWTYRAVTYNSFADLRANGNPYFGLSNLGVVSRSSWAKTQMALLGNITTEQIELYKSICKILKDYLSRSRIPANQLGSNNWQEILAEIRSIKIELTIEELRGIIDRIGSLIRAHASPIVERYDDPSLFISIDDRSNFLEPSIEALDEAFTQIFAIVDRFMNSLSAEDRNTIALRHHQNLKQNDIAKSIAKERSQVDWQHLSQSDINKLIKQYQPQVSRQLGKIYLSLLDCLHSQIPHPDDGEVRKNSEAIDAVKQLLDKYFQRDRS
jgi:hypothetical protein